MTTQDIRTQKNLTIAVINRDYNTLSEIIIALKHNIPVVGLNTWSLSKNGKLVRSIHAAKDAHDAVAKAMKYTRL